VPSKEPTQLLKIVPKCTKHVIFTPKKSENFLGRGHSPLPRPLPLGEGHPSPCSTPQVPRLQLDPGYATDPSLHRF